MEKLNLTLVQTTLHWENAQANRDHFSKILEEISEATDLILLPEMFSTGFSMNAKKLAEPTSGKTLQWMKERAHEKDAMVIGSVIIVEHDNYYNRLFAVSPDGKIKHYDKKHLFSFADEEKHYSAGKKKLIIDYRGWKICPLVCYDLRFPVWSRNIEDYDLLLYVANWPQKRTEAWDSLLKARAIENMAYVAGLNRVGKDGNGHNYNGHSAVYDMLGTQISTVENEKTFTETLVLHKSALKKARHQFPFLNDRDTFTVR